MHHTLHAVQSVAYWTLYLKFRQRLVNEYNHMHVLQNRTDDHDILTYYSYCRRRRNMLMGNVLNQKWFIGERNQNTENVEHPMNSTPSYMPEANIKGGDK